MIILTLMPARRHSAIASARLGPWRVNQADQAQRFQFIHVRQQIRPHDQTPQRESAACHCQYPQRLLRQAGRSGCSTQAPALVQRQHPGVGDDLAATRNKTSGAPLTCQQRPVVGAVKVAMNLLPNRMEARQPRCRRVSTARHPARPWCASASSAPSVGSPISSRRGSRASLHSSSGSNSSSSSLAPSGWQLTVDTALRLVALATDLISRPREP